MKQIVMVNVNGNQVIDTALFPDMNGLHKSLFGSNQMALNRLFPGLSRESQLIRLECAEREFVEERMYAWNEEALEYQETINCFLAGTGRM